MEPREYANRRVAVIGSDPAGLMAAEVLACAGLAVTRVRADADRETTKGRRLPALRAFD